MNQSALIGGALLAGFVLFLSARDRLSTYGRVMWGAKPDSHAVDTPPPVGAMDGKTVPGSDLEDVLRGLQAFGMDV